MILWVTMGGDLDAVGVAMRELSWQTSEGGVVASAERLKIQIDLPLEWCSAQDVFVFPYQLLL